MSALLSPAAVADPTEEVREHRRFSCDEGHRDGVDDALLDDAYYGAIILRGESPS